MIERACAVCGTLFATYPCRSSRYCGRECFHKAHAEHLRRNHPVERTCEACGARFTRTPKGKHIARFCSPKCAASGNVGRTPTNAKPGVPIVCASCGKTFTVQPNVASTAKYCSRPCAGAARQGRPAWNAAPPVTIKCESCGKSFDAAPARAKVARFCSWECTSAWKRTIRGAAHPLTVEKPLMPCEMCGKIVAVKPSLVSRFRFCSRRCAGAFVATTWPRTSSIERALHEELAARGVAFVTEHRVGQFAVDIALPELRIAVEADGTYWHGRPAQVAKDERKDRWLTQRGWTVLRLSEARIRANVGECVDEIMALAQCREPTSACTGN